MKSLYRLVLVLAGLMAVSVATAASTSQRLDLLERRVGRITELTLQLDEVRRENRELRGEIENLAHQIEQLLEALRVEVAARPHRRHHLSGRLGGGPGVEHPEAAESG